jgi:hypothetical protein
MPQVDTQDQMIEEMEDANVCLEYCAEVAEEALEKATTSHQLEVAQVDGKHSRLLDDYKRKEKGYNQMAVEKAQEEVRVPCACRSWLLLLLRSVMDSVVSRALPVLRLRCPTSVEHAYSKYGTIAAIGPCICCCCCCCGIHNR